MTPVVIVLDGEQRAALAVVRSLGAHQYPVHVGSSVRNSLAGGSRFAKSETVLPDPLSQTADYCRAVRTLTKASGATIVFPITEASTLALLTHGEMFRHVRIAAPTLEAFLRASDKDAVLSLGKALGVNVPHQWIVNQLCSEPPPVPADQFPVVLKPTRSVVGEEGHRQKTGVVYAETPSELRTLLSEALPGAGEVLVQSRIVGPGVGIFLLRWDGMIQASFAHRRLLEKPPSGGVSVRSESIAAPPQLFEQATALLDALDYTGVAMIEFKQDQQTGQHYLMEINPRFWGSLQLAIDAGVNFPLYLAQLGEGRDVAPPKGWRTGIRLRWTLGVLDHLITRLRHTPRELHLPPSAPGLIETARAALLPWSPRQRGEVLRLSDPVPGIREFRLWVRDLVLPRSE